MAFELPKGAVVVEEEAFDPEGSGYDYETARRYGIQPDKTGHWQSRIPKTGLLLKGRGHPTWYKTVEGEAQAGYKITKKGGRYYSHQPEFKLPANAVEVKEAPRKKGFWQRFREQSVKHDIRTRTRESVKRLPGAFEEWLQAPEEAEPKGLKRIGVAAKKGLREAYETEPGAFVSGAAKAVGIQPREEMGASSVTPENVEMGGRIFAFSQVYGALRTAAVKWAAPIVGAKLAPWVGATTAAFAYPSAREVVTSAQTGEDPDFKKAAGEGAFIAILDLGTMGLQRVAEPIGINLAKAWRRITGQEFTKEFAKFGEIARNNPAVRENMRVNLRLLTRAERAALTKHLSVTSGASVKDARALVKQAMVPATTTPTVAAGAAAPVSVVPGVAPPTVKEFTLPANAVEVDPFEISKELPVGTEVTWRSTKTGDLTTGIISSIKPTGDYLVKTGEGLRTIKPDRVVQTKEAVEALPEEFKLPENAVEIPPVSPEVAPGATQAEIAPIAPQEGAIAEPTSQPVAGEVGTAEYAHYQEPQTLRSGKQTKGYHEYHITRGPNKGSTVSAQTLEKMGIAVPETPTAPVEKQPWEMSKKGFDVEEAKGMGVTWNNATKTKEGKIIISSTLDHGDMIAQLEEEGRVLAEQPRGWVWGKDRSTYVDVNDLEAVGGNFHEAYIKKALAEGKTVPAEVLAEYPDLAKPTPAAPAEEFVPPKGAVEVEAEVTPATEIDKWADAKPATPEPLTKLERAQMTAEFEAYREAMGEAVRPSLFKALKDAGIRMSEEDLQHVEGYGQKDLPPELTGRRRGIFVKTRWRKGLESSMKRKDLTPIDLVAERLFTPGGDLWEIGREFMGQIDPNVDLPSQLIELLISDVTDVPAATAKVEIPRVLPNETAAEFRKRLRESASVMAFQRALGYPDLPPLAPKPIDETREEFKTRLRGGKPEFYEPTTISADETAEEFRARIQARKVAPPRPTESAEDFRKRMLAGIKKYGPYGEVGWKEKARPARRVFEKIGIRKEVYEPAFDAEIELWEELMAFREEAMALRKTTDMSPESSARIFRHVERTLSTEDAEAMTSAEYKIAKWGQKFFDDWADRLGIPQHKRRKNYMTHIFEEAIAQDLKRDHPVPADLIKALEFVSPKTVFMPFLETRLGKTVGLKEDFWAAIEAYEAKALRVLHYEPLLEKMGDIEKRLPPNAANYLKEFTKRMTNRPLDIDREVQQDMKDVIDVIKDLPGGEALAEQLSKGNLAGKAAYNLTGFMYEAYMGFVPATAIKNLGQNSLTIAEVGVANFVKGVRWRKTEEGKAALAKSKILRSRRLGYLPGVDETYVKGLTSKRRETSMAMFRKADKINVSNAFASGYQEAKGLGLPEEWCIKRGDEVAANTQYVYTKLAGASWSQSVPGRVMSVFTTWPENWLELMVDWGSGKESIVYKDYSKATGSSVAPPEGWGGRRSQALRYMVIVAIAGFIEHKTRLRALTYTGWTSIKSFARMASGDFAITNTTGAIGDLIAGILTGDKRMIKRGWRGLRPDRIISITRRLEDIAAGKKDFMDLFLYMEKPEKEKKAQSRKARTRRSVRRKTRR